MDTEIFDSRKKTSEYTYKNLNFQQSYSPPGVRTHFKARDLRDKLDNPIYNIDFGQKNQTFADTHSHNQQNLNNAARN